MEETIKFSNFSISDTKKNALNLADDGEDKQKVAPGTLISKCSNKVDPVAALASAWREFGEHGGVNMSMEASATFTVMEAEIMTRLCSGELGPDEDYFIYSRQFNPTVLNLGRQMAALEGTEAAYCTASGMSAITAVLLQLVSAGGHVVASQCLYGGTHALLTRFLVHACGIKTTFVNINNIEEVRSAIRPGETKVLYVETMSNLTLVVADIPALATMAREKGVKLVVDNTFTPMLVSPARPAKLISSMTNHQGGALKLTGPTMNAKVAFEISERLPHLALRMKEHSARAMAYAIRMKQLGLKVIYPGLPDHPHHSLLSSIGNPEYGYGGMLCLDMGTEERATKLMQHLQNVTQFGLMAVSLGYYDTLMSCSGSSTSSETPPEERAKAGISPGLIRMSVGYSGTFEQRWAQFERALALIQ